MISTPDRSLYRPPSYLEMGLIFAIAVPCMVGAAVIGGIVWIGVRCKG